MDRPEELASCHTRRSQIVRKLIVGKLRGKAAGEVVIPSCDPAAQVGDPRLIKPVFGKVLVGEDADAGEMIQDCLQVEIRVMAAGKILKIGI